MNNTPNTLPEEIKLQIRQKAKDYAEENQYSGDLADIEYGNIKEWTEADYINGATAYALKLQQAEEMMEKMVKALDKIIEMNRQHAQDQYGDPDKAETWSCVMVAREPLTEYNNYKQTKDASQRKED